MYVRNMTIKKISQKSIPENIESLSEVYLEPSTQHDGVFCENSGKKAPLQIFD